MKACKRAKSYRGVGPLRCNKGKGCDVCKAKFNAIRVEADNGLEFVLKSDHMIENSSDLHLHIGYRNAISRAFSGRPFVLTTYRGFNTYFERNVYHTPGSSIAIGCMAFFGENYEKLKKWALS